MSDPIGHECGIAVVRLLQPLQHYVQHYREALWGFQKLFLLMEKQHNRGQDGAGIGCCKLGMPWGLPYMERERETGPNSLARIFARQIEAFNGAEKAGQILPDFAHTVKEHFAFGGEVLLGHLRYGTSGGYGKSSCHPYYRRSSYAGRALMVMGNFNMTNTPALNAKLIERGHHPIFDTDTQTVLEEIGYHLDIENQRLQQRLEAEGFRGDQAQRLAAAQLDVRRVLAEAAKVWDGGYVISGCFGNGDTFVMRDPVGIRPAYYLHTHEVLAVASERVPLMTVFEAEATQMHEIPPGHVLIIKANQEVRLERFAEPQPRRSCSFERIYFSRGNDPEIYEERRALGAALVPQVVKSLQGDFNHAVFSYIPNTAETAYYGLMRGLRVQRRQTVKAEILAAQAEGTLTPELLDRIILAGWPRSEKIAHKDQKLRTFITEEKHRKKLVSHVYDITYGQVSGADTLLVIDDSIVRGTTLRESILRILARTRPARLVILSTAPQIRYPDCYGIDMSELGKFIAFQAAVALLRARGREALLTQVAEACRAELRRPLAEQANAVRALYEPFTAEEISAQVAELVRPRDMAIPLEVIFQRIEDLHRAIPGHLGDWYFTGDYPTPGGYAVCNQAYLNWFENREHRRPSDMATVSMAPATLETARLA